MQSADSLSTLRPSVPLSLRRFVAPSLRRFCPPPPFPPLPVRANSTNDRACAPLAQPPPIPPWFSPRVVIPSRHDHHRTPPTRTQPSRTHPHRVRREIALRQRVPEQSLPTLSSLHTAPTRILPPSPRFPPSRLSFSATSQVRTTLALQPARPDLPPRVPHAATVRYHPPSHRPDPRSGQPARTGRGRGAHRASHAGPRAHPACRGRAGRVGQALRTRLQLSCRRPPGGDQPQGRVADPPRTRQDPPCDTADAIARFRPLSAYSPPSPHAPPWPPCHGPRNGVSVPLCPLTSPRTRTIPARS